MQTRKNRGYLHVYTGNGKGKTTAAAGLCLRAFGAGMKVLFVQFIKQGNYSEIKAFDMFKENITIKQYGFPGFMKKGEVKQEYIHKSKKGLAETGRYLESGEYDLVVMDEGCMAVYYGLITEEELIKVIDARDERTELVLTGRYASDRLIQKADLVTEMREIKHYFNKGVQARKGIEM